ncbi:MAG: ABC transporter permease [Chloroflexi bacterium]|nr:MAG: ABC transporter permease [Chloroflexota bacterium]
MAVAETTPSAAVPAVRRRTAGLWADALYRLARNKAAIVGGVLVILLTLTAIFAAQIAPYSYSEQYRELTDAVPAWMVTLFPMIKPYAQISDQFPLGADYVGRDLLSRTIYGAQISLSVAFVGPVIALLVGTVYGLISGYFGGRVDNVMMRFVDIMYAFPTMLLIILMMAFFRSTFAESEPGSFAFTMNAIDRRFGGMLFIFIGIGITAWMGTARLARGQVLSLREQEFTLAARAMGAGGLRIIFRHLLPNVLGPLVITVTLAIPRYISTEAFLSFIGLGVNAPTPSWGSMISDGAQAIRTYPHQAIIPSLALSITMFAFNFLGDGLRDALDPRLRGVQ